MKNIVFVSFYRAYPPISGAASVTCNMATHTEGRVSLIQLGLENKMEKTADGVSVVTLGRFSENRLKKISRLTGTTRQIMQVIKEIGPEAVVLEGASWVFYHWLLLRQIRIQLPSVRIVYHAHNVEYLLRKEKNSRFVTLLTKWAEKKVLKGSDVSYAVSEVDRRQFESLYGVSPQLLPNGVDMAKFQAVTEENLRHIRNKYGLDANTILFMGSYFYKPNREGVDFLMKQVMPEVMRRYPYMRMVIIGGEVPYKEPWLVNPGVIQQTELPAFIQACGIGAAPIFSGSGTRLKILEYMAAGKPVVASSKGAEGLNIQDEENILLADEADRFIEKIISLITRPEHAEKVGLAGRRLVESGYSWSRIMANFTMMLETSP